MENFTIVWQIQCNHDECIPTRPENVGVFLSSDTRLPLGVMARLSFNIVIMMFGVQEELP